mmetsp:Transcript_45293/g.81921  ORF Transcript_45293/g.81921 Transcript_45293/m.81921 type:complete len:203 (+) Transcript_45293:329-937(+)
MMILLGLILVLHIRMHVAPKPRLLRSEESTSVQHCLQLQWISAQRQWTLSHLDNLGIRVAVSKLDRKLCWQPEPDLPEEVVGMLNEKRPLRAHCFLVDALIADNLSHQLPRSLPFKAHEHLADRLAIHRFVHERLFRFGKARHDRLHFSNVWAITRLKAKCLGPYQHHAITLVAVLADVSCDPCLAKSITVKQTWAQNLNKS